MTEPAGTGTAGGGRRSMSIRWRIVATAAVLLAVTAGTLVAVPAQAIVGGVDAGPYSFMGSIQVKASANAHLCGASLIRAQWMVTAAHCTFDYDGRPFQPSEWQVRIGSTNRTQGGDVRDVTTIIRHPDFVPTGEISPFDIALIKLSSPSTMAPISVPSSSPAAFTSLRLLGWGRTVAECPDGNPERCPGPPIPLKQLDTFLVDDSSCANLHGPIELCVFGTTTQTPCRGDSGGPALTGSGSSWQIVGVTSNGTEPCGLTDTIYTDVTAFTDWIAGQLGEGGGGGTSANPADLNGDGKADLLAVYDGSLGLYWYPGKGDGNFWSARYLGQAGFKVIAKRDLDRDGKA